MKKSIAIIGVFLMMISLTSFSAPTKNIISKNISTVEVGGRGTGPT